MLSVVTPCDLIQFETHVYLHQVYWIELPDLPINAQFMLPVFFGPDRHPLPQTLQCLLSDLICLIASYWGMMRDAYMMDCVG